MGQFKKKLMEEEMENTINNDLIDFLKELTEREELKGVSSGIAKQVIHKGVRSMSKKQKAVINNVVESYKKNNKCEICNNTNVNALTDYINIAEYGLCPMCEHDKEKFMTE